MTKGPLDGIRIVEFTSAWAGPYATCLLGFLGAEVIKVESMAYIDHSRYISFSTGKEFTSPNESSVFNTLNLNKKSVALNLKQPEAVEIAKKLLEICDATIENMRPGVIERIGLGYDVARSVKPDIIYLSSSACGQTGPHKEFMGYAPTFAAMAGLPHITGYEDSPPSNFMGSIDLRSATMSAFALLTALIHHQNTGEGQYIDLSSQEVIAALCGDIFMEYVFNHQSPGRSGNKDKFMAPHNCYRCTGHDNWISIAVGSEAEWQGLCSAMEKPELAEDKRFDSAENRLRHLDELDRIINDWTSDQDYYSVMKKLQDKGVAAAPSMSGEALFKDPHLKDRGVFQQVDHPVIGKDWVITPPWKLSETPAEIRQCSPMLGEHNEDVLCGLLKMNPDEVRHLTEKKIVY